jgi:hypothetical protein
MTTPSELIKNQTEMSYGNSADCYSDGERFLFNAENFKRICAVHEDATPGFSVNTNAATMTITFSVTHAPPINYNLNGEQ